MSFEFLEQCILFSAFQLEEGEIDVRYNSFKGCTLDELNKRK